MNKQKISSSLPLKYRPSCLDEVAGNFETVKALDSVLSRPHPPQAYLLTGPSGCGKTTLARIIKNRLGCSDHDYIEMDCGDERGIDNIRNIRRQMRLSPISGKCRVWLMDESHAIGKGGASSKNEAQNALLKALEEPPPHVYFILATTNPEMLLKTIRTRCATFEVKPLSEKLMIGHLSKICRLERKRVPQDVLSQIAKDSLGSCRVALMILDKVIDLPAEEMQAAAEQQAVKENATIDLCRALLQRKPWAAVAGILKNLEDDPETIRRAVMGYMSAVLLNKYSPQAHLIMDCFRDNFYDNGRPGLVLACCEIIKGE